jgi:hypothetical protein
MVLQSKAPLLRSDDKEKAAPAAIFYEKYVTAREHVDYRRRKEAHVREYEQAS